MASSWPRMWRYRVFTSFHGPDVHETFLSYLRKQLSSNGIKMFNDQWIERSQIIASALTQAIKGSRISIVVFSKNYASSSRCLDELWEILRCKDDIGHIVMPLFYGVHPSHVRKQIGEFGKVFKKTCAQQTMEKRLKWIRALNYVGNISGERFQNWKNEANMIEKITIPRDFEDMVGIGAHLQEMQSLLHLDYEDETMIVGICGPPGIGKTTIARALESRLSSNFHLSCFMGNLRGYSGLDEYGLKLQLQKQLLSKILNENGVTIPHLGSIKERLSDKKVLIILDDVDDLKQLKALAGETNWFGPGSRIIVTTKDHELLRQHGIGSIYLVDFPSSEEALEIFSIYAFGQRYPINGFTELAKTVVDMSGNLPLSLSNLGSSLRGKKEEEWELHIHQRLRTSSLPLSLSNRCSTVMAFLVVINLFLEITSTVADQLSSIRKPYFARISLVMSVLSLFLSIFDIAYKIQSGKARFRCKWPIPWFYYSEPDYIRIFGNFTDTVLLFCAIGGLLVSTINYSFIERRREGPIKVSVWPLFFAIGMVVSKFMEKSVIPKESSLEQIRIEE